jgi:hypothetical protein
MVAVRRDAFTLGPPHVCGRGCPGKGEAFSDTQAKEAYQHHREELEQGLGRMLAARRVWATSFRPRWWWLLAPDAEPYRADSGEFEDPGDFATSTVELEGWVRESIRRRQIEEVGRLRFLARHGLLEPWEEEQVLSRGGIRAKALKQELTRKATP